MLIKRSHLFITLLCFLSVSVPTEANKNETIQLSDGEGHNISIEKPARRIVALAPHIVENVFSVGLGEYIVGAVGHSDYPKAANDIPHVGNFNAISMESIIALNPDLILAWGSGNHRTTLMQLRKLGYIVHIANPNSFEDIAKTLIDYATLGGKPQNGLRVASEFLLSMNTLKAKNQKSERLTVFYQVWNSPLQSLNGEHLLSKVIELCGGRNIFSDAQATAPLVNVESVIAENPMLIIASGMGEARPEWLEDWRRYTMIDAVKYDNLIHIHPDLLQRHTLRIYEGAKEMCLAIEQAHTKLDKQS